MNIEIDNNKKFFELKQFQKMIIIYNALEEGWKIKKKGDKYIFKKRHNNSSQYFSDTYLNEFLEKNLKY
jgi:hypothetical protein